MKSLSDIYAQYPVLENVSFAWVGQKTAATGTANANTGAYSLYGEFLAFAGGNHKERRDQFIADYYHVNNQTFKGTTLRIETINGACLSYKESGSKWVDTF